ncbi:Pacifastin inhibitor (LCMII) [Popillia japonica]|uniref:Pacifastin inhibitor (LCMII) n=1 Tax=Popillia japonica TaxID=7064 RepID=A0AAW1MD53_POPJA
MKTNITLLVVILIFGFVACIPLDTSSVENQKKCETPGKTFFDGCNNCGCSEDGIVTWCTYKFCPPSSILPTVVVDKVPEEKAIVA